MKKTKVLLSMITLSVVIVTVYVSVIVSNAKHFLKNTNKINELQLIKQNPELPNGCEVTSASIMLKYNGINVDKMELAQKLPQSIPNIQYFSIRDNTSALIESGLDYLKREAIWGDPSEGFVGSMSTPKQVIDKNLAIEIIKKKGKDPIVDKELLQKLIGGTINPIGYGVNPAPLKKLLDNYSNNVIDLTGSDFFKIEEAIDNDQPVTTWITNSLTTNVSRYSWKTPSNKKIIVDFDTHVVVVIGYDKNLVYFLDPLKSGNLTFSALKEDFKASYEYNGKKALTLQSR
ncbi:C39 family peptidase [Bacillus thuringiensis]|uniref:C39 family peptidase n=1 Tax=Bacillus thuringiensis TaxID=1428 RepID=UPI0026E18A54|nr:C39 family peptidase [Bacillus thuringiensis]MDO6632226.1 C39 family peptidase [Bacillus thuringiensis]MDO6661729.1 C39 family peptidase [Bacillus thuringiensis]MDO6702473.1 C39 family peptidase [Bacillus thuringiensis]